MDKCTNKVEPKDLPDNNAEAKAKKIMDTITDLTENCLDEESDVGIFLALKDVGNGHSRHIGYCSGKGHRLFELVQSSMKENDNFRAIVIMSAMEYLGMERKGNE